MTVDVAPVVRRLDATAKSLNAVRRHRQNSVFSFQIALRLKPSWRGVAAIARISFAGSK
jgi:hypothetical protein